METEAEKQRASDEAAILDAVRELGGGVRFRTILTKLGWSYGSANNEYRRLDTGLQRLKKRGALVLANMRWSLP